MDEQNSQELKIVKRDLEKNGISFNSLTPKAQNLLIKSEDFLQTQKDKFKESFQAGSDGATTSLVMSCLSPTNSKSSGKNSIFSKSIINHPFLI